MLSSADVAWMAGIMEGGYFGSRRKGDLIVELVLTDEGAVDRIQALVSRGKKSSWGLPSGNTAYRWRLGDQASAAGLMMTLYPLMSESRQSQIERCLGAWKKTPVQSRHITHCRAGHPLAGDNLLVVTEGKYRKRRCRTCGMLRMRKYRARHSGAN